MKKVLFLLVAFVALIGCSSRLVEKQQGFVGIPNPWTDCGTDLEQASQIAGFFFPVTLSNYDVRAMKDMIEINYPLDENRTVCLRKTNSAKFTSDTGGEYKGDISGVYIDYPVKKVITIKNSVPVYIRGAKDKIYVMNMAASNGYYSAYCKQGMSLEEIEQIYETIAEAESHNLIY
ncbi:MAG: hypothetical protein IKN62_08775 [Elusimicrobia bacterium]|nr:hypothetical protein [Elusimicrobiota bacterium]